VERTRDGLDVTSLDLHPGEIMRLWLMRSWSALETVGAIGGGRSFERSARMLFGTSPNVALLTVSSADRESYFRGGRALQRVWLTASALGLSIHPCSELVSLFARLMRGQGAGLGEGAIQILKPLWQRFRGLFNIAAGEAEIMLLRVHQGGASSVRSLRRPLGSVLVFEDARGRRVRPAPSGA
jgi:hypothetical protein